MAESSRRPRRWLKYGIWVNVAWLRRGIGPSSQHLLSLSGRNAGLRRNSGRRHHDRQRALYRGWVLAQVSEMYAFNRTLGDGRQNTQFGLSGPVPTP